MAGVLALIYQGIDVSSALRLTVGRDYAEFEADLTDWLLTWGEHDPRYQSYYPDYLINNVTVDCYLMFPPMRSKLADTSVSTVSTLGRLYC